jgi:hypothetical protein
MENIAPGVATCIVSFASASYVVDGRCSRHRSIRVSPINDVYFGDVKLYITKKSGVFNTNTTYALQDDVF